MLKKIFVLFLSTFVGLQAARTKQTYTPKHPLYGAILTEQAGVMSYVLTDRVGTQIPITGSVLLRELQQSGDGDEIYKKEIVVKTDTATGQRSYQFRVQLKFSII